MTDPANYNALASEIAFIGCLILDPELIETVRDRGMSVKWLKIPENQRIFEYIMQCYDEGKLIDPVTIVDSGIDEDHINQAMDSVTSTSNFEQYAKSIGLARLNEALKIRLSRNPENPEMVRSLLDSFADKFETKSMLDLRDIAKANADEVKKEEPEIEMPLPWKNLNTLLGGIRRQKLYFIGGLPGHRKTDFAINIGQHILEKGFTVLYCDYEMGESDTFLRFYTKKSRVPNTYISTRIKEHGVALTDIERVTIADTMEDYGQKMHGRLNIICYPKINEVKNMIKSTGADVVFIDHIQLFAEEHPIRQGETKAAHINTLCRRLKKLSRELNVAIICPSQIGRQCSGPPKKSDFKESAGMSENGDVLIGVWWPQAEQLSKDSKGKTCNKNYFELELAKHRGGPVGRDELHVEVETGFMTEFSRREAPLDNRGGKEEEQCEL